MKRDENFPFEEWDLFNEADLSGQEAGGGMKREILVLDRVPLTGASLQVELPSSFVNTLILPPFGKEQRLRRCLPSARVWIVCLHHYQQPNLSELKRAAANSRGQGISTRKSHQESAFTGGTDLVSTQLQQWQRKQVFGPQTSLPEVTY